MQYFLFLSTENCTCNKTFTDVTDVLMQPGFGGRLSSGELTHKAVVYLLIQGTYL